MNQTYYCFIKEQYFLDNPNLQNMLDPGNMSKQSRHTHICIKVHIQNNNVYIPLRNHLGKPIRKFGKIGFPVPSQKRPHAGLDYRYSLIINNDKYIEKHTEQKIPNSQYNTINSNFSTIEKEMNEYINKYIKSANKTVI